MEEEFFVGYQKNMPPGTSRFVKRKVASIIILILGLAALLVIGQRQFSSAHFEFGEVYAFTGIAQTTPYPHLILTQTTHPDAEVLRHYYLVSPGKFGGQKLFTEDVGVQFEGTMIRRDDQRMIEVIPDSISTVVVDEVQADPGTVSLGMMKLRGEIVDSKCYLGVMKPGNLKPHKSCAIRCISGGVPPVLVVRDKEGHAVYVLLTDENGAPVNTFVLDLVAEPVEVSGEVFQRENLIFMQAPLENFKRVTQVN